MCRLGFLSTRGKMDLTTITMLATAHYGRYSNTDGTGYAFWDGTKMKAEKSKEEAELFWLNRDYRQIFADNVIFHVRQGTNGNVTDNNAHPFWNKEGHIAVVHNGILSNYEPFKKKLIQKGYAFTSETDSEIILHAYCEYGEKFTEELNKEGVTGSATILILDKDTIILYTNNTSIKVYDSAFGFVGFSDGQFVTYGEDIKIKKDTLYYFQKGKIIKTTNVKGISEWDYSSVNYGGYSYYWEKNDKGVYVKKACNETVFMRDDDLSDAVERFVSKQFGIPFKNVFAEFAGDKIKIEIEGKKRDLVDAKVWFGHSKYNKREGKLRIIMTVSEFAKDNVNANEKRLIEQLNEYDKYQKKKSESKIEVEYVSDEESRYRKWQDEQRKGFDF
jgi:predicted glutamine amidotransferase